jgi:hypothetical protein
MVFMRLRFTQALWGCIAALLPVAVSAELSQKIRSEIAAPLAPYTPPPPEPPKPVGIPAPLSDDPVVNLPNYRVEDKRVPANQADLWLTPGELQKKQMREYKKNMTAVGWLLNGWSIPLIGTPVKARAKAEYENNRIQGEFQRLHEMADAIEKFDPAEAKKLRASLDTTKLPKD